MVIFHQNVSPNPLHMRMLLFIWGTLIFSLLFLCACATFEIDTTVSLDGNNPPSFKFSGSGYLTFFTVTEIASENQNVPQAQQNRTKNNVIWWIWPSEPLKTPMWKTEPITYGKTPSGFYQKAPEQGEPPKLAEGKVYEAGGPAASANGGYIRFTIRDGKSVQLPIP